MAIPEAAKYQAREIYGKVPLHFEANQGQTDAQVKFLSRGSAYTLFLTPTGAVLSLSLPQAQLRTEKAELARQVQPHKTSAVVLRMELVGANPNPKILGLDQLPGKSNYFIGNAPKKWRTNIPHYAKVQYRNVYPGVDLVFYGNQRRLEYDFVVAPGADAEAIQLAFEGAQRLTLDARGNLILGIANGEVVQKAPLIYQEVAGIKQVVGGRYVLKGENRVGFQVVAYDVSRPLIIDPVLFYSTYLGGSGLDIGDSLAVDASGNAYVSGFTASIDFPTEGSPFQPDYGSGAFDAFVTKINDTGTALVYSTYLGGSGFDRGNSIAVDASGNAYVTGGTTSPNFPTAGSPSPFQAMLGVGSDAFVTKINDTGTALVYSTYLGGNADDGGASIAVDASGNAYVTGITNSSDFPTTAGAFDTTFNGGNDNFVTKVNPAGTALVYSTYLGGTDDDSGGGIAVDASGNAYVTGVTHSTDFPTAGSPPFQAAHASGAIQDSYVTKINDTGTALVYSTYLGGTGRDSPTSIAVDASGNAYVAGFTASTDFPTAGSPFQPDYGSGPFDVYVTKVNVTGTALVYSTYLGGSGEDSQGRIAVDASGNAYVTGFTTSANFPTEGSPFQPDSGGGRDAFVTKINDTGTALVYSTYLGGSGFDRGASIAVDASGNAYVTGGTTSPNFPTAGSPFQPDYGGGSDDAFVVKISTPQAAAIQNQIVTLQDIVDDPLTGQELAKKVGDAFTKLQTALDELNKGPDNQAAVGNIEGAVGDLEAAVESGLLDAAQGADLMDPLAGIARQLVVDAIGDAITRGGVPDKITLAQQALTAGDVLRDMDEFKNAVAEYKDAVAQAEGA